jgi:hypothetical protein
MTTIRLSTQEKEDLEYIKQDLEFIKKTKLTYGEVIKELVEYRKRNDSELQNINRDTKYHRKKMMDRLPLPTNIVYHIKM